MKPEKEITVLHLTSSHPAFDGRIFHKEARSLAGKYNVVIISPFNKAGKLFDFAGNSYDEGLYEGVKQLGCSLKRDAFQKVWNRLFGDYGKRTKRIDDVLKKNGIKPDLIHFHEVELLPVAKALKKIHDCKLIFDSHEMFLADVIDKSMRCFKLNKFLFLANFMKKFIPGLDATVSANNIIKSVNVCLAPNILHETIYNSSLFTSVSIDETTKQFFKNEKTVLVHEGTMSKNRGFQIMCDIFEDKWAKDNVVLKVVGSLDKATKEYFERRCLAQPWLKDCIYITGWKKYNDVPDFISGSIGIIMMEPSYNNLLAGPPNKLFNYLVADMPVISFEIPASADIIRQYEIGDIAGRSVDSILSSINKIAKDREYYSNKVMAAKEHLSWKSEELKLFNLYNRILRK